MKTIIVASRKGGVGKTTLATHLAVAAEAAGAGPVALIDTDPQSSAADWWNAREAETPVFVQRDKAGLPAMLKAIAAQGIKLAIVDTPPSTNPELAGTIAAGDLILIPVTPSPIDIRAVGGTVDIIRKAKRPMIFVLNRATARTRIAADTAVALSEHGQVAPSIIPASVAFAVAMADGRTAMETDPHGKGAAAIAALWQVIAGKLGKGKGSNRD